MAAAPVIHLIVKYPAPGRVKTRLIPAIGAEQAATLHRRLSERTLAGIRSSGLDHVVRYDGADRDDFADWLGPDVRLAPQGPGDLGDRLARIEPPAVAVGGDIPDLTADHLRQAAFALESHAAVIGPAADGGYYLIGLARPMPFLWPAMPWGSERVFDETVARLERHGIVPALLETLADCDRPEDLARWPELAA